jgi:hypothetical protein
LGVPYSSDLRRALEEELTVYRLVPTDDPSDAALLDAFRSRAELQLPPRTWTPEGEHPELNSGLSAFDTIEGARRTALAAARRQKPLADFIAEVRLTPAAEAEIAVWGSRGHLTIWGDPIKLRDGVVDIVPVGEP